MRSVSFLTIFFLLLFISASIFAQQSHTTTGDEVSFYVTVTNSRGEWIGGLTPQNFRIREGKSDYEITSFSSAETPVSVGFLIDVSGSTLPYLRYVPSAVSYFAKASKRETEMFVMLFNTQQTIIVEPTSNHEEVVKALRSLTITPKGNTALFDSIDAALEKLSEGKYGKKALIVFSDAQDNASKQSFEQIRRKLRRSHVLLYNVNVPESGSARSQFAEKAMSWIERLAALTGGRAMYAINIKDFFEISYRTGEELRYQYKVGFKPSITDSDSKKSDWREFDVSLKVTPAVKSRFGEMKIRAREGYYPDSIAAK